MPAHQFGGLPTFVLGALDGPDHRFVAPGKQQKQALPRPIESRHELRAVLNRKPAGGSRARIDEPAAAIPQARLHGERRFEDLAARGPHCGDGGELSFDHRVESIARLPLVDA